MKIVPFYFCILLSIVGMGQEKESIHELYQRLSLKKNGYLGENKHKNYPKITASYSFGINMVSLDDENVELDKTNYQSIDFRGSYQTTGKNIYDKLYRFPEWGIGFYGVKPYNDDIFGIPNAIFGYIDVPLKKWNPKKKLSFSYSIGGGMSFNFNPNNPEFNPINSLIGSFNNVYIDLAYWAKYRVSKTLDLKLGLSFVHFSNGASSMPNMGMNLFGPKLQLQHNLLGEMPIIEEEEIIPKWKKKHGVFLYQAGGTKQLSDGGPNYFNATTSLAYKYWFSYKGRAIAQVDAFYDSSNNSGDKNREMVPIEDRDNPANLWSVGLFLGYEAVYNRLSFVSGWGYYLWRRYEYTSPSYQRFGVRYRVYEGLSLGVGLKARSFAADYIEWSIGYDIF